VTHGWLDSAVAVDGNDAILVTDRENHKLRIITGEEARVSTLAGTEEVYLTVCVYDVFVCVRVCVYVCVRVCLCVRVCVCMIF
jgi:hypothetical protein